MALDIYTRRLEPNLLNENSKVPKLKRIGSFIQKDLQMIYSKRMMLEVI